MGARQPGSQLEDRAAGQQSACRPDAQIRVSARRAAKQAASKTASIPGLVTSRLDFGLLNGLETIWCLQSVASVTRKLLILVGKLAVDSLSCTNSAMLGDTSTAS